MESQKSTQEIRDLQSHQKQYEEQIKLHQEKHFTSEEKVRAARRIMASIKNKGGAELAFNEKRFIVKI